MHMHASKLMSLTELRYCSSLRRQNILDQHPDRNKQRMTVSALVIYSTYVVNPGTPKLSPVVRGL
jgi:hypothetical protein